jgi:hypothetical protein
MGCGNLPQCQTDGLNSFSTSAEQTVLLHINQQTILTPDEIANSTYICTACLTRAWSATIASASQPALIPESSTHIGWPACPRPSHSQSINMHLWARITHSRIYTRNKWMLNLQPASHSATARKTYEHWAGSPRNGRFKPTSPVALQAGAQNVSKEDLRPSSVSPTQRARFKSTSAVRRKQPFSGPTAAGVCTCNDSREQWC